ncbi:MAG: hypothetical protein ACI8WB_005569 [Phenylobacterium sp.]|jgi:uncharacterized protein (DUF697 family)
MAENTESSAATEEVAATSAENEVCETQEAANNIVSKYMGWGAGAGAVPIPLWDIVAIGSVQVMMLKELYALYGVSFSEKKARSTVSLLLGSVSPQILVGATAATLFKFVPVVGPLLASVSLPILASAATYATGKVMTAHLEAGGTQEDFDAKGSKEKFTEAVEKGKNIAKNVKAKVTPAKKEATA